VKALQLEGYTMKNRNPSPPAPLGEDGGAIVPAGQGEILLYQTEDGRTRVECRFQDETIWLSQAMMAELYQTSKQNISLHLHNLYREGELDVDRVVKEYLTTGPDGKTYSVLHYSLDAILAVGYRVRSQRGTQFRRWATERLREYLLKGFVLDDERLKNPPAPGLGVPDYFDEMLERIRDIRASERRMYLRVREIFAMAADYELSSEQTTLFFRVIQNKLHFAATGMTAAELTKGRANHALLGGLRAGADSAKSEFWRPPGASCDQASVASCICAIRRFPGFSIPRISA
jgi:hypothetical protein